MGERYYLKADHHTEWTEVNRSQFIHAEQSAGFRSKFGPRHVATSGFSGAGTKGRVDYVNDDEGDVMEGRGQLPTLEEIRTAANNLRGLKNACDITRAKPEFVTFIHVVSPASVLTLLDQHAALIEQRDRLTRMLATVIDANYGATVHDIGNGDGINEQDATEIQEWWTTHLERIRRDALATVEQEAR